MTDLIEWIIDLIVDSLRAQVLWVVILFSGLNLIGCSSAPKQIETKPDDIAAMIAEFPDVRQEAALRDAITEGFKTGYLQAKEENNLILREILLPLVETHLATYDRNKECEAIYKAGRGNFPNAETEVDCLVTQRRVKDANSWIKYYEELQKKGLIVVTDNKGGSNE